MHRVQKCLKKTHFNSNFTGTRLDVHVYIIPGVQNGKALQYSCLENPKDRGDCWATVHGVEKYLTQLNTYTYNGGERNS